MVGIGTRGLHSVGTDKVMVSRYIRSRCASNNARLSESIDDGVQVYKSRQRGGIGQSDSGNGFMSAANAAHAKSRAVIWSPMNTELPVAC